MATTTFTIYSRYDPEKEKERLQRETGQLLDDTTEPDDEELWREAASAQFLRSQRPPPTFVPATISHDTGSGEAGVKAMKAPAPENTLGSSLSSWYRSLAVSKDGITASQPTLIPIPSKSTASSIEIPKGPPNPVPARRDKGRDDWFIRKVLPPEASSIPSIPPPTLADILAREPPPLPSEPKYSPPVWTEIGPSNKGFTMLQKRGWNEGEALGPKVIRRRSVHPLTSFVDADDVAFSEKGKQRVGVMKSEKNRGPRTMKQEPHDSVSGAGSDADVIDLTLSDSETLSEDGETGEVETRQGLDGNFSEDTGSTSSHGRTALLTPIATVLKLDRLGIGLKAKTTGPYKASVKRVTHNTAALAAHIREAEEARRRREHFGRGRRGYERQRRKEEDKRRNLLAYMNT